jgi:hypothetical protein
MTHMHRAALLLVLGAGVASAQPAPAPDKVDAQSLVLSGVKLLQAHDYLGALAIFKDAYTRFPSPKILLDIGTTLTFLQRNAEAANTYQRYVDAPDADPGKRAEVQAALDKLDVSLGRLAITVTPADAEIQVGDDDWAPAARWHLAHVDPGTFTVRARKSGYQTTGKSGPVAAADHVAVALTLAPNPVEVSTTVHAGRPMQDGEDATPVEPTSALGVYAALHADFAHSGVAGLVGGNYQATDHVALRVAAILGGNYGVYGGATLALFSGRVRPMFSAGVPVFFSSGTRVGVRGAGGVMIAATHHVSVVIEAGVEHYFDTQMDFAPTLFVPEVGVIGAL